jgi:hypothetical protein
LTGLLLAALSAVAGLSPLLVLAAWLVSWVALLELGHLLEPIVLRRLGCRSLSRLDRERVDPVVCARIDVLVVDAAELWSLRGLRTVVVTSGLFDLLEDRALGGYLSQADAEIRSGGVAGEVAVWLGSLPLSLGWWATTTLVQVGRLLAVFVGSCLYLPMLLWPNGFARFGGVVFGGLFVGVVGVALVSGGWPGPGLLLLVAWVWAPAVRALVAFEQRRVEAHADHVVAETGAGWQLLEALETLTGLDAVQPPTGLLGLWARSSASIARRADRLWLRLSRP